MLRLLPMSLLMLTTVLGACADSEVADDDVDASTEDAGEPDAHSPDPDAGAADAAPSPAHIAAPIVSHDLGVVSPNVRHEFTVRFVNDGGSPSGVMALWSVGNDVDFVHETCLGAILPPGGSCSVTMALESATLGGHRITLHGEADPGGHEVIEILATVATTTGSTRFP